MILLLSIIAALVIVAFVIFLVWIGEKFPRAFLTTILALTVFSLLVAACYSIIEKAFK